MPTFLQRDPPVPAAGGGRPAGGRRRRQGRRAGRRPGGPVRLRQLPVRTLPARSTSTTRSPDCASCGPRWKTTSSGGREQENRKDDKRAAEKGNGKDDQAGGGDDSQIADLKRNDLHEKVDLPRLDALLEGALTRRAEAEWGAKRALSSLREAMGVPADCHLVPAQDLLFDVCPDLDCGKLVAAALALRPEVVAAAVGVEVTGLEVAAQAARCLPLTMPTFAAGSDLHSLPLPATQTDERYRPGAVAPDMPVTLNGRRADRVNSAVALKDRAATVLDKTRNLVQLQAEQAYLRYRSAQAQMIHFERAARLAKESQDQTAGRYFGPLQSEVYSLTQLLAVGQMASDLRAAAYQARYQMLLALVELEHHTGGGFRAELEKAAVIPPPPPMTMSQAERKKIRAEIEKELKRRGGE
ncbi:MAG: TolC family protein [Gemmataceae bacterium]